MMFRSRPYAEEKQCTRCREWWPCDAEFFRLDDRMRRGRRVREWASRCHACETEAKREAA
jgi:hypothetical protein